MVGLILGNGISMCFVKYQPDDNHLGSTNAAIKNYQN